MWDPKGFRNQRDKLSMWSQQGEDKLSLDRPISFPTCLEHLASWTKMFLPFQLCQPVKPRLFLSSNGLIHQPKSLLSTWVTRVTPCDRGRGFTHLNVYGPYGLVRPCTVRPLWTSPITPMLNTPSSALTPLCFTSLYSTLQHSPSSLALWSLSLDTMRSSSLKTSPKKTHWDKTLMREKE